MPHGQMKKMIGVGLLPPSLKRSEIRSARFTNKRTAPSPGKERKSTSLLKKKRRVSRVKEKNFSDQGRPRLKRKKVPPRKKEEKARDRGWTGKKTPPPIRMETKVVREGPNT